MNEAMKDHIDRIVAAAPPLTTEQADRIAAIIRPVNRPLTAQQHALLTYAEAGVSVATRARKERIARLAAGLDLD